MPKNGRQRTSLDRRVLGDHNDPAVRVAVHRVTTLGPYVHESGLAQRLNDLAEREVGQGWAHAAVPIWNEVTSGVASMAG